MLVWPSVRRPSGHFCRDLQTSLPDEIADILNYMDVCMVFCDDQEQVDKLVEIRDRIPKVKKVIYEDPRGMRGYRADDWFMHDRRSVWVG